jgi:hypothetical protein
MPAYASISRCHLTKANPPLDLHSLLTRNNEYQLFTRDLAQTLPLNQILNVNKHPLTPSVTSPAMAHTFLQHSAYIN